MGKLSELILKENVAAIVTFISQNNETEVKAKYVGKDKEDIYPQVIDGADIPKSNIKEVKVIDDNTDEERGYKGDVKEIIESYNRHQKIAPVGEQSHVVIGRKIYKVKQTRSETDIERLRLAKEKREANKKAKKEQEEELIRLRVEKEIRDKEAQEKAAELRERMNKETELEKLRAEEKLIKDRADAEAKAKRDALRKTERAEKIKAEAEKAEAELKAKEEASKRAEEAERLRSEQEAKEKADYDSIVDKNKDREADYTSNKLKEKEFEKIKTTEEKPRSSGLINTAVRSLRF